MKARQHEIHTHTHTYTHLSSISLSTLHKYMTPTSRAVERASRLKTENQVVKKISEAGENDLRREPDIGIPIMGFPILVVG